MKDGCVALCVCTGRLSSDSVAIDRAVPAGMLLLRRAIDVYKTIIIDKRDPRTAEWPLMGSPLWPLGIIIVYVWFVKYKGPELMANRKAFDLRWVLVAFNALQVILNAYVFYLTMVLGWLNDYSFRCQPVDFSLAPNALQVATGCYLYFIVKLIDLLDTVFYVLRKRDRQISFLHVYHHAGMVLLTHSGATYLPGGHGVFLGTLNTFVHVIMYSYYLYTALRPTFHNRIWWKKYLTQLQMAQFLLIILHMLQLLWEECDYPRWVPFVIVPQNTFMLALFADFYRSAYLNPKRHRVAGAAANTTLPREGGMCNTLQASSKEDAKKENGCVSRRKEE